MSRIVRFSEAVTLALHTVVYLAAFPDEPLPTRKIATALHVSEAHLSKVLQRLTKAHIVQPSRGIKGGFSLAKDPALVSLLDVFTAIEGELELSRCLFDRPACPVPRCIMGTLLVDLTEQAKDYLKKTKLSDLITIFAE